MRLVCPTCDAEYEIARTAIPRSGREVECSNCGHSWFQAFADLTIDEALADDSEDASDPRIPDVSHPDVSRPVDDAVLQVLRQEAEREVKARLAETGRRGLEAQTETALPTIHSDLDTLHAGRGDQDLAVQDPSARSRRDLLPAIDEVTAALQDGPLPKVPASGRPLSEVPVPPKAQPTALARIFLLLVLAAVILLALYVFAPLIAQNLPALAQTSADYVAAVDHVLLWGQGHLQQAADWLHAVWQRLVR